jgi:hypothetical protein
MDFHHSTANLARVKWARSGSESRTSPGSFHPRKREQRSIRGIAVNNKREIARRYLVGAFFMGVLTACGGTPPPQTQQPQPPVPETPPRNVGAIIKYLNDLPPGEAPVTRKDEKLSSSLSTQTDATGPKACAIEKRRITDNFDELPILTAANSNIVAGLAIQGKTIADGTMQVLPLARGPMTYVIDLPIADAQVNVKQVTLADAEQALATLQLRAATVDAPGRLSYSAQIANSFEHAALSLGVGAKYAGPLVTTGFNVSYDDSKSLAQRTIVAKLVQPMYTVSVADDKLSTPADFLGDKVTIDDLKALEAQALIGPTNLPAFIKSVTYGRVVYYSITTEDAQSNLELAAAVNASYLGFEGNVSAKTAYQRIMTRATVRVLALGGSQDDALAAIRAGDFSLFFKPVKVTQAVPLAYKLNYLHRDRAVVAIKSALDYTVRDCTACSTSKQLEYHVAYNWGPYHADGGLFGYTHDDGFGGACDAGWTRSRIERPIFNGSNPGTCDGSWVSGDPADCRANVHRGIPVFGGQDCQMDVVEQREVPNQPPLCPR